MEARSTLSGRPSGTTKKSMRRKSTLTAFSWKSAAANRRPAGQSDGSGNLFATVAADRAFPAAVAELGR